MESGLPSFPRNSTCSVVLGYLRQKQHLPFAYGALTLCSGPFQSLRLGGTRSRTPRRGFPSGPTTPAPQRLQPYMKQVWAPPLSLTTTRGILSFPRGTKMFQFPHLPPHSLYIQLPVTGHDPGRVAPFGYPRINACRRLPAAFRSPLRPSSALGAKASTTRPY